MRSKIIGATDAGAIWPTTPEGIHKTIEAVTVASKAAIDSSTVDELCEQIVALEKTDDKLEKGDPRQRKLERRSFVKAIVLANRTHEVIFRRFHDPNILPYLHVTLVFIRYLTSFPTVCDVVARSFPWKLTSLLLNTLSDLTDYTRVEGESLPFSKEHDSRPLPEDYAMRGLLWVEGDCAIYGCRSSRVDACCVNDLFCGEERSDYEKYMELPSMNEQRKQRVLWLGCRIAAKDGQWLRYDSKTRRFSVAPRFDIELEGLSELGNVGNVSHPI
jgi:hypothetical protein